MEKTCANHPDAPAAAPCKVCEKPLCVACATPTDGKVLCSPECVSVYSEVTQWVDRKALPEEWNPVADSAAPPPVSEPSVVGLPKDETVLDATRARPSASGEERLETPPGPSDDPSIIIRPRDEPPPDAPCAQHPETPAVGICTQCSKPFCSSCAIEMSWGKFCSVECSIARPAAGAAPRRGRGPLWLAAASLLAAVGLFVFWPRTHNSTPPVARAKPILHDAPKAEPLKPLPPPAEPPKVAPKPVEPKTGPPKVDPGKVEPTPKPTEPPKVAVPPKPVPVVEPSSAKATEGGPPKVEPPPKPVVVEPPKPELPKPVVETPKPELPKSPPVVVDAPPPPNVNQSLEEAARLIRDVAPLFKEIADALDENVSDRGALRGLLSKVERVRKNLREAQRIYLKVAPSTPDPTLIDGRIRRIDSLLETTAGCVEQIKSRL